MTQNERISLPLWWKLLLFILSIVLFGLQLGLLYHSFIVYVRDTFLGVGWLYLVSELIGLITVLFVIRRKIPTNYKITWCVLILLLPVPFTVLYVLNQLSKYFSAKSYKKYQTIIKPEDDSKALDELKIKDLYAYNMVNAFKHAEPICVYQNVDFKYFKDAKDKHIDMLEELKNAKHYVYLEYFIISPGKLFDSLYPILLELGNKGIDIKIIYDDLGSKGGLHRKMVKKLTQIPNCNVACYQPVGLNFNLLANYRDHRKVCIIDGRIAYCGGDNLADEYIHERVRYGYWRDTCGKYTGNAAISFTRMFLSTWDRVTKEKSELPKMDIVNTTNDSFIIPVWDGPTNHETPHYDLVCSLISSATKSIYISTPYFVVDDAIIALLVRKIKSGVDVRILMPHIPDKKTAFYMGRLNYRDIYKSGGKIYEFTKGFNHSKGIIIDDKYAFIGTLNIDYRSLFLHYECGALIINDKEIITMKEDFLNTVNDSELFDYKAWYKKKWYQRIIGYIFSLFAPLF